MNNKMMNYGKHSVNYDDLDAITAVFDGPLTCGPKVEEFEKNLKYFTGYEFCSVCNSGTAALHVALLAAGVRSWHDVIVPALSFIATASVVYHTCRLKFCDVDPETGLIDIYSMINLITEKTKAIICVDYAGQQCNYEKIKRICEQNNIVLVSDACHSFGALRNYYNNCIADITCYSFHPVKHITTGEGGAILTNNDYFAVNAQALINHGRFREGQTSLISRNPESIYVGFNYRMPDINAALGISQLKKYDKKMERIYEIVIKYNAEIEENKCLTKMKKKNIHVYHLYVVKVKNRNEFVNQLKEKGINPGIHYDPIYKHAAFVGYMKEGMSCCYNVEEISKQVISLPLYYSLTDSQVEYIINCVNEISLKMEENL